MGENMMKRRVISSVFCFIIMVMSVFVFSACAPSSNGTQHKRLTLTFVVDGQTYATVKTRGDLKISLPDDPEKSGYFFDGWFFDENEWNNQLFANTFVTEPLTQNKSVYAKFTEITPDPARLIDAYEDFGLSMTKVLTIDPYMHENNAYSNVVQGGCTDGTYYYVALVVGSDKTVNCTGAIRKYRLSDFALVATVDNLKLSHANDMAYNPTTKELVIPHCLPDGQNVSIFDAETLTFKRKVTLSFEEGIGQIAYDEYEKCYWAQISYTYNFVKLDLDFNVIGSVYTGRDTGYTRQSMDVDSKYIYFLQYNTNALLIYDKVGNFIKEVALPVSSNEPENIWHVGNDFYIGYYNKGMGYGGMLYKTQIVEK